MNWITEILIMLGALSVISLVYCIFRLWRNERLSKFLRDLLEEEDEYTKKRINDGKGYDGFRRYEALPNYDTMLNQFWVRFDSYRKPLSDFYKD